MIFVTCGSSHLPFNRMMEALSALPRDELHVQHGPAPRPPCAQAHRYMPFDDVVAQMNAADTVVCHAGVGSIICAIRAGHVPVVFPRLKRFREAVDDHQEELAAALASRNAVLVARTAQELAAAVAAQHPRGRAENVEEHTLALAVRAALQGRDRRWLQIRTGPGGAASPPAAGPAPMQESAPEGR